MAFCMFICIDSNVNVLGVECDYIVTAECIIKWTCSWQQDAGSQSGHTKGFNEADVDVSNSDNAASSSLFFFP